MIQRPQSLLLVLVTILHILLFFIPVFVWSAPNLGAGYATLNILDHTLFSTINVLIILFNIFIIFQFKNRKRQRICTYILTVIIILDILLYSNFVARFTIANDYVLIPARSYGMFGQLLSLILCFFAIKRIKKDDDLVKSIDRIR